MSIAEALLAEFETQAPITRKYLERLPNDKLTWKPHPKSMTAGQLALHLALVPGALAKFVSINPAQVPGGFNAPQPATIEEVLTAFDQSAATVREVLGSTDDAAMNETWQLMAGDRVLQAVPRQAALRDLMLSHWYQHRGQFAVYLRLLDVPVPASWGPSADEPPVFMQETAGVTA